MSFQAFLDVLGPEVEDPEEGIEKATTFIVFPALSIFRIIPPLFAIYSISKPRIR